MRFRDLKRTIKIMEPDEVLRANVRANLERGYDEAAPHDPQDTEVALLAGGPSLELFDRSGFRGPVITTNGAYNWALGRGYEPAATVVVDPRELNCRFVSPVRSKCRYLVSSQCHPALAAGLPKEQVWLWHCGDMSRDVIETWARETSREHRWFPVFGGSTVMLRAIPLLAMLGIRKMHIYGFDSCVIDGKHHAYAQPENDGAPLIEIELEGRTFLCQNWQAYQAQEFVDEVKMLPEDLQLAVHGDGLIAHILKTGAAYGRKRVETLQLGKEVLTHRRHRPKRRDSEARAL